MDEMTKGPGNFFTVRELYPNASRNQLALTFQGLIRSNQLEIDELEKKLAALKAKQVRLRAEYESFERYNGSGSTPQSLMFVPEAKVEKQYDVHRLFGFAGSQTKYKFIARLLGEPGKPFSHNPIEMERVTKEFSIAGKSVGLVLQNTSTDQRHYNITKGLLKGCDGLVMVLDKDSLKDPIRETETLVQLQTDIGKEIVIALIVMCQDRADVDMEKLQTFCAQHHIQESLLVNLEKVDALRKDTDELFVKMLNAVEELNAAKTVANNKGSMQKKRGQ